MAAGKSLFAVVLMFVALAGCGSRSTNPITQEELVRRTQEMMDAVAPGQKGPWQEYLAEDVIYFDEKGRLHDKASMIGELSPLPAGYVGKIKVANARSHIEGDTAILSYDIDEALTIYGQKLGARFHATDTWMRRGGRWQMVAAQVLRYYGDPAEGKPDPERYGDYVGTYELAPGVTRTVTMEGGKLFSRRGERPKEELLTESGDVYFRKGVEGRVLFRRNERGKVDAVIDRRNYEDIVWTKK
ncbi:MAG TPA: DUF4440 domain-containing protein [Terriglobales bacterium]|nr:DUF4440 domain-containing protein [Terriglobales bacterium]